jgi:hypothetical protein
MLIVALNAVNEYPRFALKASKALGDLIQTRVQPLNEGCLVHSRLDVERMDHSEHVAPPGFLLSPEDGNAAILKYQPTTN